MMDGGVMLCPVISSLQCAWVPIKPELVLIDTPIAEPVEAHVSMAFVRLGWTRELMMPSAVELSVLTGGRGLLVPHLL